MDEETKAERQTRGTAVRPKMGDQAQCWEPSLGAQQMCPGIAPRGQLVSVAHLHGLWGSNRHTRLHGWQQTLKERLPPCS